MMRVRSKVTDQSSSRSIDPAVTGRSFRLSSRKSRHSVSDGGLPAMTGWLGLPATASGVIVTGMKRSLSGFRAWKKRSSTDALAPSLNPRPPSVAPKSSTWMLA